MHVCTLLLQVDPVVPDLSNTVDPFLNSQPKIFSLLNALAIVSSFFSKRPAHAPYCCCTKEKPEMKPTEPWLLGRCFQSLKSFISLLNTPFYQ